MPLVDRTETVRVDLPAAGEWVDVRAHLSRGEEVSIRQRLVAGAMVRAGSADVSLDAASAVEAAEFATLELAIVGWSFGVAVSPAAIRQLDGESVDAIKVRLDQLYAPRSDAEKKGSGGSGPTRLAARAPSQLSTAG